MCRNGSSTCVKIHVWNTALTPVLIYGCQCVNFNATSFQNLEKTQGKLVKSAMGLHKYCKTTPLLHGLNLCKINDILSTFQLNLVCQIFNSTSKARSFYAHLLNCEAGDDFAYCKNTLIDRVKNSFSLHKDFSLLNCIISPSFRRKFNSDFKYVNCVSHGICDSVKTILFRNQLLECDDLGALGQLLRSF